MTLTNDDYKKIIKEKELFIKKHKLTAKDQDKLAKIMIKYVDLFLHLKNNKKRLKTALIILKMTKLKNRRKRKHFYNRSRK